MESLSNQNSNATSNSSTANTELTLFGIDKKWVRSAGSWVDKSKLKVEAKRPVRDLNILEAGGSPSHWWQFWKA